MNLSSDGIEKLYELVKKSGLKMESIYVFGGRDSVYRFAALADSSSGAAEIHVPGAVGLSNNGLSSGMPDRRARKQWTDSSLVVPSYAILATPY
jgi:hypothetical protein